MKKFLMTLAVAVTAMSASAQVYVGGNFGVSSHKVEGNDTKTEYSVLPEVGYNFNNSWAVGTTVGFGKGNPMNNGNEATLRNYFTVQPYVRYTFVHSKYVNVFTDLGFGYAHYNHADASVPASINAWEAGFRPGVAVNLSKKLSFVAHVGLLGWQQAKYDGTDAGKTTDWGVSLNGNNLTFGLYYNF